MVAAKVFGFFFFKRTNTTLVRRRRACAHQCRARPAQSAIASHPPSPAHIQQTHTHTRCAAPPPPRRPPQKLRESLPEGVQEVEYEVLNILEFNSTRKRMSVVLRAPDNRIVLYCKARPALGCGRWGAARAGAGAHAPGTLAAHTVWPAAPPYPPAPHAARAQGADTVVYERLAPGHPTNGALRDATLRHMEDYGSAGLRTLCLAYKELDAAFYDACAPAAT